MQAGQLVHATCVSLGGKGVLLLGEVGAGKSDLALRLIDRGASLVADDQVQLTARDKKIMAAAPQALRGRIEVRGIGIMTMEYIPSVPLSLAVQLVRAQLVERMPEAEFWGCLGLRVPLLSLCAFEESTAAKIRLFLKR